MHNPASKDTPSISSDRSSIFRTSTRSAARKDNQLVKGLVGMTKGKKLFALSDPEVPSQTSAHSMVDDGWSYLCWFMDISDNYVHAYFVPTAATQPSLFLKKRAFFLARLPTHPQYYTAPVKDLFKQYLT